MANRGPQLDLDTKAQIVLFAAVYGDEKAAKKYKIALRTIRRYRTHVRNPESELSKVVRKYADALHAETVKPERFATWLKSQVQDASDLLMKKANKIDDGNTDVLRALNEFIQTLANHGAALEYIARLFGDDQSRDSEHTETRQVAPSTWGTGTEDGASATA